MFMMYQESPEYQVNKGMSLDDFKLFSSGNICIASLAELWVSFAWSLIFGLFRGKLSGNLKLKGLCLNILVISQG